MFISKRNDIIFPQSEHVKLATVLATHWGNEIFHKPPVPYASFIKAVANHDNGYGHFDSSAIGQQTEEGILKLWQRCTDQILNDPYAEIIIKRHFMRLTSIYPNFPRLIKFHNSVEQDVTDLYKKHNLDPYIFDVTDTIMHACDAISFAFCQEVTSRWELEVYTNHAIAEKTTITYSIDANHTISIDPNPLDDALITGVLTAYDKKDYPDVLLQNEISYQIMNRI